MGGFASSFTFPTCKKVVWALAQISGFRIWAKAQSTFEALKTASDAPARYEAKKRLICMLYERKYERDEVLDILRYLDWMMHLSEDLEKRLLQEIRTFKSETYPEMTKYVTSWERFAREEGVEEGLQEGLEKGRKEKAKLVIRLLQKRFGKLSTTVQGKIAVLSAERLDQLFDAGLEFSAKEEITEWLSTFQDNPIGE